MTSLRFGDAVIELVTVRDLEQMVDRDRLLCDDSLEPPYWALVWSGAKVLARELVGGVPCEGKTFLEVGCGLGLVALTAATRGATVTAIDRCPEALAFVAASARRADLEITCEAADVSRLLATRTFDRIAAAELLYDRKEFPELAQCFHRLLAPEGLLLLADARRIDTRDFYAELAACGLVLLTQVEQRIDEEGTSVRVLLSTYTTRSGA